MLLPQRWFRLWAGFLFRLEYVCPWAIVALNLVVLPTGLPEMNLSLEKGEEQRHQDFSPQVLR